jgi:phage gp46-like protein
MQRLEKADIKIYRDPNAWGEINHITDNTPELSEGLENMVTMSIFTERKEDGFSSGWFGDELIGFNTGSRLRSLQRKNIKTGLLVEIERAVSESLEWMIDEGIASEINVSATRAKRQKNKIYFSINVIRGPRQNINFLYLYNWDSQPTYTRIGV